MIERFNIVVNSKNYLRVDDKTKEKFYLNEKEVVDLLNELNDENEQLKHQNELLEEELLQCKAVINKKWSKYLKKKELQE